MSVSWNAGRTSSDRLGRLGGAGRCALLVLAALLGCGRCGQEEMAVGTLDGSLPEASVPAGGYDRCGNGLDDDGDGEVDEDCYCVSRERQRCYGGAAERAGRGACGWGEQRCEAVEFGQWGACEGYGEPRSEECNGVDDDCDGAVDEGCSCSAGQERPCEGPSAGACEPGVQRCGSDGTWGACEGRVGPRAELCGNGEDDDCNGVVDDPGFCECAPIPEVCDNGEDDDCDGEIDESGCVRVGRPGDDAGASMDSEADASNDGEGGMIDAASPCRSASDCPTGTVCVLETGRCEPASPERCGLPPRDAPIGTADFGDPCYLGDAYDEEGSWSLCADGFVCVPHRLAYDYDAMEYVPDESPPRNLQSSNRCLPACDPCREDACPSGETCIALTRGGGFCHRGPLLEEGQRCEEAPTTGWTVFVGQCAPGLTCIRHEGFRNWSCGRPCAPEGGFVRGERYRGYYPSPDCGMGEACLIQGSPGYAGVCTRAHLAGIGEACGESRGIACNAAMGLVCRLNCTPEEGCTPGTECAPGVFCRRVTILARGYSPTNVNLCIRSGAQPRGYPCEVDSDCVSGLRCLVADERMSTEAKICKAE